MSDALVQSATIQLKAQAGGGFGSVPSGGLSGGTPALAWSASGLSDGETMTITTDGSGGWNFGVAPAEISTLGFGQGLLYTAPLGFNLPKNHTDAFSNALWEWERNDYDTSREIVEESGVRSLKTTAIADVAGGGFLTWRASSELPDQTKVFMSHLSKAKGDYFNYPIEWFEIAAITSTTITLAAPYTGYSPTTYTNCTASPSQTSDAEADYFQAKPVDGSNIVTITSGDPLANGIKAGDFFGRIGASQWKGLRISDTGEYGSNTGQSNVYTTPQNSTMREYGVHCNWLNFDVGSLYGGVGDQWVDSWTRVHVEAMLGTKDVADGWLRGNMYNPSIPSGTHTNVYMNGGAPFVLHESAAGQRKWQAFSYQEFSHYVLGAELSRTDVLIQVGTLARVELADGATPDTSTASYVLPPSLVDWSANQIKVLLWKAFFTTFSGKYIHAYDDDGVFRKGVQI